MLSENLMIGSGSLGTITTNSLQIGDGTLGIKQLLWKISHESNLPGFRYSDVAGKVQFSHDGTTWKNPVDGSLVYTKEYIDDNYYTAEEMYSKDQLDATFNSVASGGIAAGTVVIWSGSIIDIPGGFSLCNGQNGTPDMRDRFVVGAGSAYAIRATGGAVANTGLATSDVSGAHDHGGTVTPAGAHGHSGTTNIAGAHQHGGNTGGTVLTVAQMPPHKHVANINNVFGPGEGPDGNPHNPTPQSGVALGSAVTYVPDNFSSRDLSGGNQAHSHTITIDGDHTHSINFSFAADHTHALTAAQVPGHTHTMDVRPPYYALAFIIKV